MQFTQLASLVLLSTVTLAALQSPAKPPAASAPEKEGNEKQDKQEKTKSAPELEAERIRNELLGAWQLVRFDMSGEVLTGASCRGYLIVTNEYLSLDLQVDSKYVHNLDNKGQLFSSSVQKWQYEQGRLVLTTNSLIGVSNFTPEEIVLYERAGTPREYRVNFAGDELTLERNPTSHMLFRRMSRPAPPAETPPADKKK